MATSEKRVTRPKVLKAITVLYLLEHLYNLAQPKHNSRMIVFEKDLPGINVVTYNVYVMKIM